MTRDEAYKALEIELGTELEGIKRAFRRLSKRYHPDKHTEDNHDWAVEHFRQTKQAYQVLLSSLEEDKAKQAKERLSHLRRLRIAPDGTLQESVLLGVHPSYCIDVGAWNKEPPFFSRIIFKLASNLEHLELRTFKTEDFENLDHLRKAESLGTLEVDDPPSSLTVLTKVDRRGGIKMSLLGEHRFLKFQWKQP